MRLLLVVIAVIVLVVGVFVGYLLMKGVGGDSVSYLAVLDSLRHLVLNSSFTATYTGRFSYYTATTGVGSNVSVIYYVSSSLPNGSLYFCGTSVTYVATDKPSAVPRLSCNIFFTNSTGSYVLTYTVFSDNRSTAFVSPLQGGLRRALVSSPMTSLVLGNYSSSSIISVNGVIYNYTVVRTVKYSGRSAWHGRVTYCFNVTGIVKDISIERIAASVIINGTYLVCLLPNGVPATEVGREVHLVSVATQSQTVVSTINMTLINYEINYFNASGYNELMSEALSHLG